MILVTLALLIDTAGLLGQDAAGAQTTQSEAAPREVVLADFEGESRRVDPKSGTWRTVNDNIMGGRSTGGGEIRGGRMVFAGSTNTNGGGFSSVRASERDWDLSGFDGLAATIRADGRAYVFHVDTGLRHNGGNVFYRGTFETRPLVTADGDAVADAGIWEQVYVPFDAFVPMVRGRSVGNRIGPLDPASVVGIGLMIDDGLDGPFRLEVEEIVATTK